MTPERAAAVDAIERETRDALAAWLRNPPADPEQGADDVIKSFRARGWHVHPELHRYVPPPKPAPYEDVKPVLDGARATLAEKRRARQAAEAES